MVRGETPRQGGMGEKLSSPDETPAFPIDRVNQCKRCLSLTIHAPIA